MHPLCSRLPVTDNATPSSLGHPFRQRSVLVFSQVEAEAEADLCPQYLRLKNRALRTFLSTSNEALCVVSTRVRPCRVEYVSYRSAGRSPIFISMCLWTPSSGIFYPRWGRQLLLAMALDICTKFIRRARDGPMRVTLEWTLYQAGWQTSDILCRRAQDPEGSKSTGQTVLRCSLPRKCSVAPMSRFRADAQAPETRPPVKSYPYACIGTRARPSARSLRPSCAWCACSPVKVAHRRSRPSMSSPRWVRSRRPCRDYRSSAVRVAPRSRSSITPALIAACEGPCIVLQEPVYASSALLSST